MRKPVDLREHARLSLHFLRNSVSSTRPGLPYFWIDFLTNPPQFAHEMSFDDIEDYGRWLYGIACAQRVAGCSDAEETRLRLIRDIDRRIAGPYHLMYSSEYSAERGSGKRYTWLWGDRSVLEGWIQCWRSERNAAEREALAGRINRMVTGLNEFAVKKGPYAFFPTYTPPLDWVTPEGMLPPDAHDRSVWGQFYADPSQAERNVLPLPTDSLGGVIWPLVEWHELSGNQPALDLAVAVANTVVHYHPMRSNPALPFGCFSNIHGVCNAMAGVLACHRHVPNPGHFIWAETLFEYFLNRCSSSFGWVTEIEVETSDLATQRLSSEGCAVVDMVRVGIELGRLGLEHGWDVAERFTRNYLTQAQIRQATPFEILEGTVVNHGGRGAIEAVPAGHRDSVDVWNRSVGALTGWGAPNDILDAKGRLAMCVQNCCSSHLPMGLLHVWDHIVTRKDETIYVNLLLSQDGEFAQTIDAQPQQGLLTIIPKQNAKIAIRIPDWVEDAQVRISADGESVPVTWPPHSRFVRLPVITAGSAIRVEYPLRERLLTERLGGVLYTTAWRGDTVTDITPKGRYIPIFSKT
jgi:hypothetical protein